MDLFVLGAGLAIGLAGLWVGIGEWLLARKSLHTMGKNPNLGGTMLVITILWIALVESAAIYGLIVALQIMWLDFATMAPGVTIGAGLAIGLAGLWVGVGQWMLVTGAMEAIHKNPQLKGKLMTFMILFLALVESAAIYGLVIALMLLGFETGMIDMYGAIGAGLAVGLAGLWVGIGEWMIAKRAMQAIGDNPDKIWSFLVLAILWIALVESAAIYGLVVSLQIIGQDPSLALNGLLGAGLAVGLAGLWVGIGEWMLVKGAMDAIHNKPNLKGKIMTFMILFLALVESAAIYGLVVAFMLMGAVGDELLLYSGVGAGLAIGIAGLWAWLGEGIIARRALQLMWRNAALIGTFLIVTILGIALVEASAIYGLIVSLQIINMDQSLLTWWMAVGAGIAVGAAWLWVGKWYVSEGALMAIIRNPAIKTKAMTYMILFLALVESVAIYGLIVALQILG